MRSRKLFGRFHGAAGPGQPPDGTFPDGPPAATPALADAMADVLLLFGPDGAVVDANRRACEAMGRDPRGMHLLDLFGVWAIASLADLVSSPPAAPQSVEAPLFGAGGQAVGFLWLASADGDRLALAGREMTHIYPLDIIRRLSTRVAELREANRIKQEILDLVSHEFKTPLTVIRGYAWLLDGEAKELGSKSIQDGLGQIVDCTDRLLALFDQVFAASRIESGRLDLHVVDTDLAVVVQDTCRSLEAAFPERAFRVAAPERVKLRQDSSKVVQCLMNLLSNALKYSPAGTPVDVSVVPAGDRWEVRVFNVHDGLAPEELGRLFERLSRLERDRDVGGSGLGLYIARGLARRLGGDIRAQSQAGVGVTVSLELPDLPGDRPPNEESV